MEYISVSFTIQESYKDLIRLIGNEMKSEFGDKWEPCESHRNKNYLGEVCKISKNQNEIGAIVHAYQSFELRIRIEDYMGTLYIFQWMGHWFSKGKEPIMVFYKGKPCDFFNKQFLPKVSPDLTNLQYTPPILDGRYGDESIKFNVLPIEKLKNQLINQLSYLK